MARQHISLIIPCYNEGSTFEASIKLIVGQLKKLDESWEVIFVEDKSTDNTKSVLEKVVPKEKNYKAIYHPKNKNVDLFF